MYVAQCSKNLITFSMPPTFLQVLSNTEFLQTLRPCTPFYPSVIISHKYTNYYIYYSAPFCLLSLSLTAKLKVLNQFSLASTDTPHSMSYHTYNKYACFIQLAFCIATFIANYNNLIRYRASTGLYLSVLHEQKLKIENI